MKFCNLDSWPLALVERVGGDAVPPSGLELAWREGEEAVERLAARAPAPDAARHWRQQAEEHLRWGGYPALEALPEADRPPALAVVAGRAARAALPPGARGARGGDHSDSRRAAEGAPPRAHGDARPRDRAARAARLGGPALAPLRPDRVAARPGRSSAQRSCSGPAAPGLIRFSDRQGSPEA